MRMRPRRAPASSSPRIWPASAPTSRRSWRSTGEDKPALSVEEHQICVEGLKHGERYTVTMRAGIPSVVKETLAKTAEFNIYVRDRKPFVRFSDKAYVLPRTGQRGIPVVSVNTAEVAVEIYRIGDRNLLETVLGRDFQTNLDRYDFERLTQEQGAQVWKGSMKVEQTLNTDVVTAFPVTEAIGALAPGVYVMHAGAAGATPDDDGQEGATQWFIVSDLGLTAFSGNDGVHAFVHSLDTAAGKGAGRDPADRAQQRDPRHQAHQRCRLCAVRGGADARGGRAIARP